MPGKSRSSDVLKKLGKAVTLDAAPLGNYYEKVYKPAIEKTGLKSVRADTEIFATGKIMDQVWSGINAAKVLVAELTTRNPNVFYELGLAHALKKPLTEHGRTATCYRKARISTHVPVQPRKNTRIAATRKRI